MQLQLSDEQIQHLLELARNRADNVILQQLASDLNTRIASNSNETDEKYRAAAAEQYEHDGTLEIDVDAPVSLSEDGGAYVQAWVWVNASTIGLTGDDPDEEDEDDD